MINIVLFWPTMWLTRVEFRNEKIYSNDENSGDIDFQNFSNHFHRSLRSILNTVNKGVYIRQIRLGVADRLD